MGISYAHTSRRTRCVFTTSVRQFIMLRTFRSNWEVSSLSVCVDVGDAEIVELYECIKMKPYWMADQRYYLRSLLHVHVERACQTVRWISDDNEPKSATCRMKARTCSRRGLCSWRGTADGVQQEHGRRYELMTEPGRNKKRVLVGRAGRGREF